MAIVTSQLVASKVLLQFLVDKDTGLPLAAGTINLYKDDNRLIRKNWYFQSGTPGAYTYSALPNPMTLNGSGVIVDSMGNEVIPYYYPFDEDNSATSQLYYITVYNSAATLQFVRQGFPPINRSEGVGEQATLQNLIVNNQFWRQSNTSQSAPPGSENTLVLTNETDIAICPSNHDGYSMPDIRFMKSTVGANDTIVFSRFTNAEDPFAVNTNVVPQFYINISCNSTIAETYKFIQFPICLNIRNLEQTPFVFTVQTSLGDGAASRNITVQLLKFQGSGSGQVAYGSTIHTISPTASWVKTTVPSTFPAFGTGEAQTSTEDDAYYIQLGLPTNRAYEFNIAVPSLYLGNVAATNDFQSYDKIDSIVNSPRTGDFRHTLNKINLGWVPANDGTIGQRGSGATTRANPDTWPLYKLIYENVAQTWAPVSGYTGVALTDFNAGRPIALTKNLGRVLQGLDPIFVTPSTFTSTVTPVNFTVTAAPGTSTINSAVTLTAGTPIQVTTSGGGILPTATIDPVGTGAPTFVASTTYYVSSTGNVPGVSFQVATTLSDAIAGTNSIVFTTNSTATCTIVNTVNTLTLATSQSPVLKAGTAVVFTTTGTLPSGLSLNTVYYITSTSLAATTITVNNNLTDALNGRFLPILTAGTGVHTVSNALGAYNGQSYTTDVPLHSHRQSTDTWSDVTALHTAGGGGIDLDNVEETNTFLTGIEKVSLIQPSAYANLYLKL